MSDLQIFIGYDPREHEAGEVLVESIRRYNKDVPVNFIFLPSLRAEKLYNRRTIMDDSKLFDCISGAPMATEFALSRFLVPTIADPKEGRFALFVDIDMMFRCDPLDIMLNVMSDPGKAIYCVKHNIEHGEGVKMDGCKQTSYHRKNWSSVMLFDLDHRANRRLTPTIVNNERGLHLHQLCWLFNDEIGELPPEWNHLVGVNDPNDNARIVHYTLGTPNMVGYEHCEHSEEWWELYKEVK